MKMDVNKYWILDGHNDSFLSIPRQDRTFAERSDIGAMDGPRIREANINAGLFAVFPAFTKRMLAKGVANWFDIVSAEENGLMHIKNVEDFEIARNTGKIGAVFHFEGAGGLDKKLVMLGKYRKMGLRSMGLTWSNRNKFATGVAFLGKEKKRGITGLGIKLIHQAQALGITVDVSHLNVPSFWGVIEHTEKPVIASHSNAHAICAHKRNLTDKQITAIHEKGGTIGINMGMAFLNPKEPGKNDPTLGFDVIKQHIDHIVSVADINTVAMGSDFDGIKTPDCMKDCTRYPKLFDYLLENGYSEQDLQKISHQNLLRVFKQTWV